MVVGENTKGATVWVQIQALLPIIFSTLGKLFDLPASNYLSSLVSVNCRKRLIELYGLSKFKVIDFLTHVCHIMLWVFAIVTSVCWPTVISFSNLRKE